MGNITFTMIKPEAVEAKNIGAILNRIENAGFRISAIKKTYLSINQAANFYKIHESKPFYKELIENITEGPIIVAILESLSIHYRFVIP